MKVPFEKHCHQDRFNPYLLKNYTTKPDIQRSPLFNCGQAYLILKAIELNERKKLSKKCIAHLSVFVSRSWEENPSQEKLQQVYYMINNLLDTTRMDPNVPFEISIQNFCARTVSTPTLCSTVTLLIAISYIERLNKRYKDLKGTAGCAFRMIMISYIMAAKYVHDCLRLIIYTNSRLSEDKHIISQLITPPTSPKKSFNSPNGPSIHVMIHKDLSPQLDTLTPAELSASVNSSAGVACQQKPDIAAIASAKPEKTDDTILPKKDEFQTTLEPTSDRNKRIARMELEFLHFLNYDLSVQDPVMLVQWAKTYEEKETEESKDYSSADEGDDELDDDDSL